MTCEYICNDLETLWVILLSFPFLNEVQKFTGTTSSLFKKYRWNWDYMFSRKVRILHLEVILEIIKVHHFFLISRNWEREKLLFCLISYKYV